MAPLPSKGGGPATARQVAEAARAAIDDPVLAELSEFVSGDGDEVGLSLHPAAEPLSFELQGGQLVAWCKTSTAGPGYHAYVVELLERIGEEHGLAWQWDEDGGGECGYHEGRDFAAVQEEMLSWLQQVSRQIAEEDWDNVLLSLPIGFEPVRPGEICSAMGTWSPAWIQEVADADPGQLAAAGAEFFPWWNRGCDAAFWNRYGRVMCWTEVPWHPPTSDEDRRSYDHALAAFARSRELDPRIVVPELEVTELRWLRDTPVESAVPPRRAGLGFRRGDMTWRATAGWTLVAPGYFYQRFEDGTLTLWFRDREIHATTFTVDGAGGADLLETATRNQRYDSEDQLVRWANDRIHARGVVRRSDTYNGWLLDARLACGDSLCSVTIVFVDPQDRPWAEQIFAAIRRRTERSSRSGDDPDDG